MPERITKTQRWLDLISLLLGRHVPLTVEEIMERVPAYAEGWRTGDPTAQASARRMFERDKDSLLSLGFSLAVKTVDVNSGEERFEGYRLERKEFYLPYVRLLAGSSEGIGEPAKPYAGLPTVELSKAEAALALDALRRVADLPGFPFAREARSALRKLGFDVDIEALPGDPVLWVERPGAVEVLERLRVVSDALLARKRVRFVYHGMYRGETTTRDVAPYGLFFQRDWYLVGHDATRDAVRVFRVARMEEVQANSKAPKRADYEIPADFRLKDYLNRGAWELLGEQDDDVVAEVQFRFPLSLWAARNGHGEPVREADDGSAVRRFEVSQANPFLRWVLSLGADAEILGPPELREAYGAMAREVAALYAHEDGVHG